MEYNIAIKNNALNRNRLTDIENRLVVAKGQGSSGSLGLAYTNYYI